jgi:hypothetical protein
MWTMLFLLVLFFCLDSAAAHGALTIPSSRTGSNLFTMCSYDRCGWFANSVKIRGKPTMNDPSILTAGTKGDLSRGDWSQTHPWRAAGTAPASACGVKGGSGGVAGTTLPPTNRSVYKQGSVAEFSFYISANHGGGYQYRLCKFGPSKTLTNKCFEANPLEFVGNTSWILNPSQNGTGSRFEIPAVRTNVGTTPAGSTWTRNPIPETAKDFAPSRPDLVGNGPFKWSILDKVQIPSGIAPGDYVLSWRWDCEITAQVWTNCADITILSGSPTPAPPPTPPPPPTPTPPTPPPTPTPPTPPPTPAPPPPTPRPTPPPGCKKAWEVCSTNAKNACCPGLTCKGNQCQR